MYKKQKSICWICQNFSSCNWSRGKPIKGWNAKPIKIKNVGFPPTDTFIVSECPKFKMDEIIDVSLNDIAKILGIESSDKVINTMRRHPEKINNLLKEKGYELYKVPTSEEYFIKIIKEKGEIKNEK